VLEAQEQPAQGGPVSEQIPATAPRLADLAWPMPPMGGVLGVAMVWYLPEPVLALPAAHDAARRQLVVWKASPSVVLGVELLLTRLIGSAVDCSTGPLFLELALREGGCVAVAVREAVPTGWAGPGSRAAQRLAVGAAGCGDLTVTALPDGSGHAYTALVHPVSDRSPAAARPTVGAWRAKARLRLGPVRRCAPGLAGATGAWCPGALEGGGSRGHGAFLTAGGHSGRSPPCSGMPELSGPPSHRHSRRSEHRCEPRAL